MVKIAVIGLIAVVLAIQFKGNKTEYGTYISLAACVMIFYLGISKLEVIIDGINKIQSLIPINKIYMSILLKIIGITYIAEFASSLCKDAGYQAISGQIEFVGKLTILSVSMPILLSLLDTINEFLS